MEPKKIIGLIGCAILVIGCFAPLVSVPIIGNINLYNQGDGKYILVLTIIAGGLMCFGLYKTSLIPTLISLASCVYALNHFSNLMEQYENSVVAKALSNPLVAQLAKVMVKSIQLQWGWAVLFIGIAMCLAGGLMGNRKKEGAQ